jgi:hypothetical protein
MSTATLDENLLPILEKATDRVVIQSKEGRVLGYFQPVPADAYDRESPYSEEEVRAILRNKGECISLEEAWKRIGAK